MKVAVYGSLREGLHNHVVLGDSEHICNGKLKGFGMYSLGAYPALSMEGKTTDVVVEVYSVDKNAMVDLDHLEGFPNYYTRKLCEIETEQGNHVAWVDYMNGPLNDELVECGDWKQYLESK